MHIASDNDQPYELEAEPIRPRKRKRESDTLLIALDNDRLNQIEGHYLGPMNVPCHSCGALYFAGEVQTCCKNGQLTPHLLPKLIQFENIPEEIRALYDRRSPHSAQFHQHSRQLNFTNGLASFGISKHLNRSQAIRATSDFGGFSLTIHGQLYHQISPLTPREGTKATFSQV